MKIALGSVALGALLVTAPTLAAQSGGSRFIEVSPYVGYAHFGSWLQGPVGTSVGTSGSAAYGAQLGLNLSRNVKLYGNIAYANSSLRLGLPLIGGVDVGGSKVWFYDGGLELSLPTGPLPISPFVQVGAGAVHYDLSSGPLSTNATNFAGNAGVGLDLRFNPIIGMRFMAKDYIGKFDVSDITGVNLGSARTSQNWVFSGGLNIGF